MHQSLLDEGVSKIGKKLNYKDVFSRAALGRTKWLTAEHNWLLKYYSMNLADGKTFVLVFCVL